MGWVYKKRVNPKSILSPLSSPFSSYFSHNGMGEISCDTTDHKMSRLRNPVRRCMWTAGLPSLRPLTTRMEGENTKNPFPLHPVT
jgi:hypothetical protein